MKFQISDLRFQISDQDLKSEISNLRSQISDKWAAPPIHKWLADDFVVTSGMNPPLSARFKSTFFPLQLHKLPEQNYCD